MSFCCVTVTCRQKSNYNRFFKELCVCVCVCVFKAAYAKLNALPKFKEGKEIHTGVEEKVREE